MYATVDPTNMDLIRVTIGGAGFSVDYYCDYVTNTGTLQRDSGNITSNVAMNLVDTPAAGQTNQMQALSIYINLGTGTVSVTIDYFNGFNPYQIFVISSMPVGYTLTYTADGAGWQVYDQNGHRL